MLTKYINIIQVLRVARLVSLEFSCILRYFGYLLIYFCNYYKTIFTFSNLKVGEEQVKQF